MISIFKKLFSSSNENESKYSNDISAAEIEVNKWLSEGRPAPPPHVIKQNILKQVKNATSYEVLIESGTYLGAMVEALIDCFSRIYSIELSEKLYQDAVKKFSGVNNVTIIQGDSGEIMKHLMEEIGEPAIFWLDGHYSAGITAKGEKECPIIEELSAIFNAKKFNHAILIDDARLFNGTNDYPTIDFIEKMVLNLRPLSDVKVEDDIIHIYLK